MDGDNDVPECGAAFTFGKSKFASNVPGKFWIRDDPILQLACGDEHTAIISASGRVFTFGNNEWGQLGHGHTNALTKPSCVKGLKHERAVVLACGRSHTLVATATGHVYGFGTNAEGQLGSPHEYTIHTAPVRIQGLEDVIVKMLSAGAEHSIALTDRGIVYVWGMGSEGQLGLDKAHCFVPTELKFDVGVMCISAGYYHSAFVTVDGKVHTCGENESGKLGIVQECKNSSLLHRVSGIQGRAMYVSCGGNHTVVLTADGKAYSFGSGFNGQLGLGDRVLETSSPHQITYLENVKIARVSCGENHTGFLSDAGYLYTCGDGRHGKLGLLDDDNGGCCNRFFPTLVKRFWEFQVQQVACGGCHMLVLAVREISAQTSVSSLAREKRRQKLMTLPPLQSPPCPVSNKTNNDSATTMRNQVHQRLPSITKSPVWYVPLEKVGDTTNSQGEDDDVLSKSERRSLLDDLEEDKSIRHFDSDVESEDLETYELNQTHTLIRIDNTISIIRPVISDCSSSFDDSASPKKEDSGNTPPYSDKITPNDEAHVEVSSTSNHVEKQPVKKTLKNKVERKSQFYDDDEEMSSKSSTSTLSKSSKACILL